MVTRAAILLAACLAALATGCVDPGADAPLPAPDRARFDSEVWPVLVRDCGFTECHGAPERFFRVLGPGHVRLDPATRLGDPVTPAELELSYQRARSMLDGADPGASLLLRKPLAVEAGGAGHEGTDVFGRDVYTSPADPGYLVIQAWVIGGLP